MSILPSPQLLLMGIGPCSFDLVRTFQLLKVRVGCLGERRCAMAVNMIITPAVLLAFPDFLTFSALRAEPMLKERASLVG